MGRVVYVRSHISCPKTVNIRNYLNKADFFLKNITSSAR